MTCYVYECILGHHTCWILWDFIFREIPTS